MIRLVLETSWSHMLSIQIALFTWEQWVQRFGDFEIFEGWGATESNTNTINVDNRVGSCGRVPFWEKTNLRLVKFDIETERMGVLHAKKHTSQ